MAMYFSDEIERVAQGLILANPDPAFRAGVIALAHALGAKRLALSTNAPSLMQLCGFREVTP